MSKDVATQSAIDTFLQAEARATGALLDVDELLRDLGAVTRWAFLCRLAAGREIAFHGTGDPGIEAFEPRQPIDFAPFGDQKAVFATSDPIWAMFYAIVDRARYPITLNNGCIELLDAEGRPGTPHYYFSISSDLLAKRPWRTGYVYLLPAEGFVEQPSGPYGGHVARVPQLASPSRSRHAHVFRSLRKTSRFWRTFAAMTMTAWPSTRRRSCPPLRGQPELLPPYVAPGRRSAWSNLLAKPSHSGSHPAVRSRAC